MYGFYLYIDLLAILNVGNENSDTVNKDCFIKLVDRALGSGLEAAEIMWKECVEIVVLKRKDEAFKVPIQSSNTTDYSKEHEIFALSKLEFLSFLSGIDIFQLMNIYI